MPRATPLHIAALGSVICVEAEDRALRSELRRLWRPLLVRSPAAAAFPCVRVVETAAGWQVLDGTTAVGAAPDIAGVVTILGTHLNGSAIGRCPDLLVHAGAVALRGRAVALPAVSGAGKSTLTAACVLSGWEYVSDEALHLHDGGGVSPYAKPLNLDGRSRAALALDLPWGTDDRERAVSIDDLRGRVAAEVLHLADVVFLDRTSDGHRSPELLPLHASEVLTGLVALSFNHYKAPLRSIELLAAAAAGCRAWRLEYSDARDAAGHLTEVLGCS